MALLGKFVKGASFCAVTMIPAVYAASSNALDPVSRPPPMRASELPIYDRPHAQYANYLQKKKDLDSKPGFIESTLGTPVKVIRTQTQEIINETEKWTGCAKENIDEVYNKSAWIVCYLREEAHKEQRYGAVAMGGLTGFIFGLRGGIIRKVVYTGVGTLVMGYICFPDETTKVVQNAASKGEHYANVAYNFIIGVKPGDPRSEIKFAGVPKTTDELKALLKKAGSSIKELVFPPKID